MTITTSDHVPLGRTSLRVSRLGFGAAPIGFLDTDPDKVDRVLGELFDHGVNLIDTAAMYPGSEPVIGRSIEPVRDELVLVSKCGPALDGDDEPVKGKAWSAPLIRKTVDRSLRRLRTDYLDVCLLHSCERSVLEKGEALGALGELRDAGKVRFIGYSGDNDAAAYAAEQDEVTVVEMSVNICDQANLETVLPICRQRDVGVLAKRPIANAAWRDPENQPGMYREYARPYAERFRVMNIRPADIGFADHVEIDWPEIALRFVLSIPGVQCALVGTTSVNNTQTNLAAVRKGPLADEAVQRLNQAFQDGQMRAGEAWPGLT